ncbi:MAG: asparagine synthase C-terminal domain-containing protein, partial [Cytophagales bacterium]|nr:asparagine synthase C-terminal domain-containing protein [Cytophagales bacterium]
SNHVQLVPVYQPSKITYRFGGRLDQVSPTPNEVVSRMEALLKNSVERHLISDRPVGLFLSGGVDSTLILSLLQDTGSRKFPVFTVGEFKSDGQDKLGSSQVTQDHVFAAMAAKQYGGELVELRLGDEILLEMDQMVAALDQPIADPAALLTFILSREAKKSISVALSGAGGDEVFAGYNRHGAFQSYLGFWRYMPYWFCDGLSLLSKQLINSPWVPMPRMKQKLVHGEKFFKDISSDPMSTFLNFTSMEFYPPIRNLQRQKVAYSKENYLNQALATDRKDFLSQDVLALTDQMSMAHALEVRLPYLDKELTDFMDNLPASFVLKYGKKWILNEILMKRNGSPYVLRKKEGFGMPLANWLRKPKNAFVFERLLDPGNSIFEWVDYARAQGIIQKHISHCADFSKEIWALAIFERWYEKKRS